VDLRRLTQQQRLRWGGLSLALLASVASATYALAAQQERPLPVLGDVERCRVYSGVPEDFARDPHAGMVYVKGGKFVQGSDRGYADERPPRSVEVPSFWIDRTEVTNAQFSAFVAATGYVTTAERAGGSAVFHAPREAELADERYAYWRFERGANFRHPEGADSQLAGRANQPVVQVSWEDATAYARWLGRELPSEAEWEYAARAAQSDETLHSAPRDRRGRPLANFWQGDFPLQNKAEDGFAAQAPVGCFAANPFGLYDSIGNVWEWTRDLYRARREGPAAVPAAVDCRADSSSASGAAEARVIKGGSFLCSANFCARYRVSARHPQEATMPALHVGFRTMRQ
jgi:formylglycine-generating enzyme required for sulfatase activity